MERKMKTTEALPQTDSIQELAKFWETHDLTDFENDLEEVAEPIFKRPTKGFRSGDTGTFTEGFEIVVNTHDDEDACDWDTGECRPEYLKTLINTLAELGISKEQVTFENTSIGVGAEAGALALIMLAGLTILAAGKKLFLAGKTINENVDAWIELAKKLRNVLDKLKADYVSQPFAAALALEEVIRNNPEARRFELEGAFIDVVPNSSMDMTGLATSDGRPIQEVFRYQQMRYYTFVIRAFDAARVEGYSANVPSAVHLICVRSTGKIEFHHVLPVRDWMRFEGFDQINSNDDWE
jgi:hypothetical protein